MESGLEGRNNGYPDRSAATTARTVSMESGLEGRNNTREGGSDRRRLRVSMESGLEGRNNDAVKACFVRIHLRVSMESGLEGRNNTCRDTTSGATALASQWSPA